jgi:hypothetical protein
MSELDAVDVQKLTSAKALAAAAKAYERACAPDGPRSKAWVEASVAVLTAAPAQDLAPGRPWEPVAHFAFTLLALHYGLSGKTRPGKGLPPVDDVTRRLVEAAWGDPERRELRSLVLRYLPVLGPLPLACFRLIFSWFEAQDRVTIYQTESAQHIYRCVGAVGDDSVRADIARRLSSHKLNKHQQGAYRAGVGAMGTGLIKLHGADVLLGALAQGERLIFTASAPSAAWVSGVGPYEVFLIDDERKVYASSTVRGKAPYAIAKEMCARWSLGDIEPRTGELAPNVHFHIDEEPPRHERFLKRKGYSPGKVPAPLPSKRKR